MQTLNFTIEINAPSSKVWSCLWEDANYRTWSGTFCEGSYKKGNLVEGGRIHFIAPSGEGMFSDISTLVLNEKMYFSHIGELKNFEEQALTDAVQQWTGGRENYNLSENNGVTTLSVVMDTVDEYVEYFQKTFPKGLEKVKEMA